MTKKQVRRKGSIQLILPYHCSSPKEVRTVLTQGRDLEAGPDAEAMEGCYLLASSPWLAQPDCETQDPQPREGTIHIISLIKKIPYRLAYSLISQNYFLN